MGSSDDGNTYVGARPYVIAEIVAYCVVVIWPTVLTLLFFSRLGRDRGE